MWSQNLDIVREGLMVGFLIFGKSPSSREPLPRRRWWLRCERNWNALALHFSPSCFLNFFHVLYYFDSLITFNWATCIQFPLSLPALTVPKHMLMTLANSYFALQCHLIHSPFLPWMLMDFVVGLRQISKHCVSEGAPSLHCKFELGFFH